MDKLSSRERRVLEARVLADKPMTLEEFADEFGIARARVRQLEARVLEKMGADYQTQPQTGRGSGEPLAHPAMNRVMDTMPIPKDRHLAETETSEVQTPYISIPNAARGCISPRCAGRLMPSQVRGGEYKWMRL